MWKLAKTLRTKILEVLEKESLNALELAERLKTKPQFLRLAKLEEEGLIELDLATDKWHLKR